MSIHTIPFSSFDESLIPREAEAYFDEAFETFEDRFTRSRNVLFFLACRILGTKKAAEEAVRNCKATASIYDPGFEREGEFRSWIARILIDEALAIKNHGTPDASIGASGNNPTPAVFYQPTTAAARIDFTRRCRMKKAFLFAVHYAFIYWVLLLAIVPLSFCQ